MKMASSPLFQHLKKVLSPRSPKIFCKTRKLATEPRSKVSNFGQRLTVASPRNWPGSPKNYLLQDLNLFTLQFEEEPPASPLEPMVTNLMNNGVNMKKRILGKGSFGTVIVANYRDRNIAVKVVKEGKMTTMNREMNALVLAHSNIVDVFQIISHPGKPFGLVLMEAWYPLTLQAVINEAYSFNLEEGIRLVLGICEALEYCHEVGIVHMDVKPKNILVCIRYLSTKLCDFGNSCNTKMPDCIPIHQGTVTHMAPELFRGCQVSDKCDVYSLGVTMWQILHKENPYTGQTHTHSLIYKVVSQTYRPETVYKPEARNYIKLYERCWHEEPTKRPTMSLIKSTLQTMI